MSTPTSKWADAGTDIRICKTPTGPSTTSPTGACYECGNGIYYVKPFIRQGIPVRGHYRHNPVSNNPAARPCTGRGESAAHAAAKDFIVNEWKRITFALKCGHADCKQILGFTAHRRLHAPKPEIPYLNWRLDLAFMSDDDKIPVIGVEVLHTHKVTLEKELGLLDILWFEVTTNDVLANVDHRADEYTISARSTRHLTCGEHCHAYVPGPRACEIPPVVQTALMELSRARAISYLDGKNVFKSGKYKGNHINHVFAIDPEYICWLAKDKPEHRIANHTEMSTTARTLLDGRCAECATPVEENKSYPWKCKDCYYKRLNRNDGLR